MAPVVAPAELVHMSIAPLSTARRRVAAASALVLLVSCGDTAEITGTINQPAGPTQSITVNAATSFVYLTLGDTARVTTVADPAASTAWDVGVFAFNTVVNSGAGGPGETRESTPSPRPAYPTPRSSAAIRSSRASMAGSTARRGRRPRLAPHAPSWWSTALPRRSIPSCGSPH
jgi:hypothetical protein